MNVHCSYNLSSVTEIYFFLVDNVKLGPGGSVLTVSNARPGNQGQYRCTASDSAGRSSATAVLNVKCELVFTIQLETVGPRKEYLTCTPFN